MRYAIRLMIVLGAMAATASATAAQLQIYDRATGQILPTYTRYGRTYVAGEPGHEYEVRIHNDESGRVLAVTTVDGVNVITGQTGSIEQSGYVLGPYDDVRVEGWRKSLSHTAAFFFTKLSNSYAARTGRPENVGVIGVALFRERVPCCRYNGNFESSSRAEKSADSAQGAAAPSVAEERGDAAKLQAPTRAEPKLGTGHGRSEYSAAEYTEFVRASSQPSETLVIYYDSERNLIAQGIIPSQPQLASRPRPFPNSFVPDP